MAFGNSTFTAASGAVNTLLSSIGAEEGGHINAASLRMRAAGSEAEAKSYGLASGLATQNEEFTKQSFAIKQAMAERDIYKTTGAMEAGFGFNGLQESGGALDLLRDSASQGALTHAILDQQSRITGAGYEEQARSYDIMRQSALDTAASERDIAGRTDALASQTGMFGEISAGFQAATAVATLFV